MCMSGCDLITNLVNRSLLSFIFWRHYLIRRVHGPLYNRPAYSIIALHQGQTCQGNLQHGGAPELSCSTIGNSNSFPRRSSICNPVHASHLVIWESPLICSSSRARMDRHRCGQHCWGCPRRGPRWPSRIPWTNRRISQFGQGPRQRSTVGLCQRMWCMATIIPWSFFL